MLHIVKEQQIEMRDKQEW